MTRAGSPAQATGRAVRAGPMAARDGGPRARAGRRLGRAGAGLLVGAVLAAPVAAAAPAQAGSPQAAPTAEVRLKLEGADVREVFASLADAANLSFVALPGLSGPVSLALQGLTVEQALELVARATGFGYVLTASTLVAGPRDALEARFGAAAVRPELPAPGPGQPARQPPPDQVAIEALVVELFVSEIGRQSWLDLSRFVLSIEPGAGVVRVTPSQAMAQLQALEQRNLARLLARPRLTTVSGQTASIFIGDETPVVLGGGTDAAERLETISVGIKLEITPVVADDGSITVDVRTEVSDKVGTVRAAGQELPQIRSRSATTRVRVWDGQAIFIGGLTRQKEGETRVGLPVLKEFPVLGPIFTSEAVEEERTDMNILLFPRLIRTDDAATATSSQASDATGVKRAAEVAGAPAEPFPLPEDLPGRAPLRPPRRPATVPRPGLRLSISDATQSAWQLSLERAAADGQGASTSLSALPATVDGQRGHAWGIGLQWRWYWPARPTALWVGLGADGLWVQRAAGSTVGQVWLLRLDGGARVALAPTPLFFEPYVRWVVLTSSSVGGLQLDRWRPGLWAGVNLGVSF